MNHIEKSKQIRFRQCIIVVLVLLGSLTGSFAQDRVTTSNEKRNTDLESASVNWKPSTVLIDSVDVVTIIKIKKFVEGEIVEVRYGTTDGSGDLIAMNLVTVKEGNNFFLLNGNVKYPVKNGEVAISTRAEAGHLQQHNRYFNLKVKDVQRKEIKHLAKTEINK